MLSISHKGLLIAGILCAASCLAEDRAMSKQEQCTEYGAYQDSESNWLTCDVDVQQEYADEAVYAEESSIDDTYHEEPYVDDSYREESYSEESYSEAPYVDESYREESDRE